MNTPAWIATLYVIGAALTFAFLMNTGATWGYERAETAKYHAIGRAALVSALWAPALVVLGIGQIFPPLMDWIEHGTRKDK